MLKGKQISNKAFTLVELLIAISILGIISIIAIPLIGNIKENNENKKYLKYLESISYSGKLYTDSYSDDMFGYQDSGCQEIKYEELKNKSLAKDIQIPDISCATDETSVYVVKLFDKYTYRAKIGCGNKNADGTVTNITKRLQENKTVNATAEQCNPDSQFNMNITATPANGTSVDKKRRKIVANISSVTGINSTISIYYSFSINNSLSGLIASEGWKKAAFTVPTEKKQRNTIFTNNEAVQIKSNQIVTPSVTGSIYLVLRIDELKDLAGVNWSKKVVDETNKYIFLGPYKVDNQKPEFKDSTVISTESGYNSLTPKLNLKATDNNMLSAESDMLACVSVDTDTCKRTASDIKNYAKYTTYKNKVLDKVSTTYNGSTHTIYVTVADKAGNYVTKSFSYKVAQKYKITYNSNGGTTCSPNNKEVLANTAWGTLCAPTKTGYKFAGWIDNDTGATVTKNTIAKKNTTVKAKWESNKVIFKIKIQSGDNLTTSTTADDGTKYTWSQNSSNLLMRSVNGATATEYAVKIDRGTNVELDLPNYNNAKYLKITKTGYTAKTDAQWICTNCKTSNLTFSQNKIKVNTNNICNSSDGDCTVHLKVNWRVNVCTVEFNPNNGLFTMETDNTSIKCNYKTSGNCTDNIRNPVGYYGATRSDYYVKSGQEWIKGSTTYDQDNGYTVTEFCPNITTGDQKATLKVNWAPYRVITYNANGGTGSTPSTNCKDNVNCQLGPNKFTRTGYQFIGWSASSTQTGVISHEYSNTGSYKFTSNKTLYAKWAVYKNNESPNEYFTTLQSAINNTNSGKTITLLTNHTETASVNFTTSGKTLTINTNNKKLTLNSPIVVSNGTMTFNGQGEIITTTEENSAITCSGGIVNIDDNVKIINNYVGTRVRGTEAIRISSGTVNFKSGSINSGVNDSLYARAVWITGGTFNMSGGTINVIAKKNGGYGGTGINNGGDSQTGGTVNMSGGTININKLGPDRCGICGHHGQTKITGGKINIKGQYNKNNVHSSKRNAGYFGFAIFENSSETGWRICYNSTNYFDLPSGVELINNWCHKSKVYTSCSSINDSHQNSTCTKS